MRLVGTTQGTTQWLHGDPIPLAGEDIDVLYDRYQHVYGQR